MLIGPEGRREEYLCQFPITERKGKKKVCTVPAVAQDLFPCYNAQLSEENMSPLQKLTFVATKQE
jgi:hypothetical protein